VREHRDPGRLVRIARATSVGETMPVVLGQRAQSATKVARLGPLECSAADRPFSRQVAPLPRRVAALPLAFFRANVL